MNKKKIFFIIFLFTAHFTVKSQNRKPDINKNTDSNKVYEYDENSHKIGDNIDLSKWKLQWSDEFNKDKQLDENWDSQNGPSEHILCSRWRENAVVKDGVLELINKKEERGGQSWTSGNIWTKKKFKYGYFECRYKYAAASGTNNSFWLMTKGADPTEGKRFEIDINEGHFPTEINTNIYNRENVIEKSNGPHQYPSLPKSFSYGIKPDYSFSLRIPVSTRKVRLISNNKSHFHIREFRVYNENYGNYPNPLSENADTDIPGLVNYVRTKKVVISSSGNYNNNTVPNMVADGSLVSSWITQEDGEKWIEFEWNEDIKIGCIQFVNGWESKGDWNGLITDFKVQYFNGTTWVDISSMNVEESMNFADNYHTYGLEWNENQIIFYFDGKIIRKSSNDFCFSESPIWLSSAIISNSVEVTNAIDGTSMKVDYVRYYQPKD